MQPKLNLKQETALKYKKHLKTESGSFSYYLHFHFKKHVKLSNSCPSILKLGQCIKCPDAEIEEGMVAITTKIGHKKKKTGLNCQTFRC